jgi:hypothetical protein
MTRMNTDEGGMTMEGEAPAEQRRTGRSALQRTNEAKM